MTNMSLVKGTDNIRPILKEIMSAPNFSMSFKTDKVEVTKSGDTLTTTDPKSKGVGGSRESI